MPPELMAALQGMSQQSDPMMGQAGPQEDAAPADLIRQMLEIADRYRQVEQDDEDLFAMEKVRSDLQGLLAAQQKESDDLLQGKASPKALRRNA